MRRLWMVPVRWFRERNWRFGRDIGLANIVSGALGVLIILLALLRLATPPVQAAIAAIARPFYPYTTAGKRETCLSNMHALGTALSLYAHDYDRYPPLTSGKETWVSLLRPFVRNPTAGDAFICPGKGIGADERRSVCSYGINRALLGDPKDTRELGEADVAGTVLLADRGDEDRLALLDPWESARRHLKTPCNVDFRHGGRATVLYWDGNVASETPGKWLNDRASWGHLAAVRASLRSLLAANPVLGQVSRAVDRKDEAAARQAVAADAGKAATGFADLLPMWKDSNDFVRDDQVEGLGWAAAQLLGAAGQPGPLRQLNEEETRRSAETLARALKPGWRHEESPDGFTVEVPDLWHMDTKQSGRYRQTYIHPETPYVMIIIEKGTASRPPVPTPMGIPGRPVPPTPTSTTIN
jgi:prepilin-type processing-associated H-X9-DG protein